MTRRSTALLRTTRNSFYYSFCTPFILQALLKGLSSDHSFLQLLRPTPPRRTRPPTTLLTMSQIVPSSFDPFATHPFTNNSGIPPQAPQPYPYPRPIPSAHQQQQQANAGKPNPAQASSLPTAQTPMTMHAPQPQRARPNATGTPAQTRQPVFEPFKLDRSSPDLKDVLAKKSSVKAKADAKTKAK